MSFDGWFRTLAKGWANIFDHATRPHQFALQVRAGADALAAHVRAALRRDRRRLDLVVHGATPNGGALCCDATLVSPRPHAWAIPSHVPRMWTGPCGSLSAESEAPCFGQRGWRQMERGGDPLRARSRQAACPACPPGSPDSCRGGLRAAAGSCPGAGGCRAAKAHATTALSRDRRGRGLVRMVLLEKGARKRLVVLVVLVVVVVVDVVVWEQRQTQQQEPERP